MLNTVYILPTGDEIRDGIVQDIDAPEIMGQFVRAYPKAEVTRLCPLADEEDIILNKIREITVQRAPDLIVLIGGSGGAIGLALLSVKTLPTRRWSAIWTRNVPGRFTARTDIFGASWFAAKRILH